MFYQDSSEVIDTPSTYLDPRQIFTGNYWDEFAFTSYLVPNEAKVLMLGLASGGGLRPLLASTKQIQLTCVDSDNESVEKCQQFYRSKFPDIKFDVIKTDARIYMNGCSEQYDLIWLDIYQTDSYSDLYFNIEFLKLLKRRLTSKGMLAVNAYGLPTQFKPLKAATAQRECARSLQRVFEFVGAIPNRRNQTLLATAEFPNFYKAEPHSELSAIDKKSFLIQGLRLQYLQTIQKTSENENDSNVSLRFADIDTEMRKEWSLLLHKLRLQGVCLKEPIELLNFIQNPIVCREYLDKVLEKKDESLINFIPILCAGEAFVRDLEVGWIFLWTLENFPKLIKYHNTMFVQIWLTQLWCLILHPSKKYRSYCFQIYSLFREVYEKSNSH